MMKNTAMSNERRKKMYRFIVSFKEANCGNSPSTREIMNAIGISTTSVAHYHLDQLERHGYIERGRDGGESRWITLKHFDVVLRPKRKRFKKRPYAVRRVRLAR